MKTLFRINALKADGALLQKCILAQDVDNKPASVVAIEAMLALAGPGATIDNLASAGKVDIDATEAA
jgi:hypothetical protein